METLAPGVENIADHWSQRNFMLAERKKSEGRKRPLRKKRRKGKKEKKERKK